jgi:C-terminal processing protease CtpA/Prc
VTDDVLLEDALEILEDESYVRDQIDWNKVRSDAYQVFEDAGVEPAIQAALDPVATIDRHSFYQSAHLASQQESSFPESPVDTEIIDPGIGYISVSGFGGGSEDNIHSYVLDLHDQIRQLASNVMCGWVVDLWDHGGGNMWPGLAGLAPLIGPGTIGFFIPLDDAVVPWMIEDSRVLAGQETIVEYESFSLPAPAPALAVVIGAGTASSGEAVALSMHNRQLTRFFGRPTFGVATANTPFPLSDGSLLVLTTALMADRTGETIPMGEEIHPDERSIDRNQAISAAVDWLIDQNSCIP